MAIEGEAGLFLLAGRVLFGGVLAFMALNHFMRLDTMTGYAESKGVPAARFAVIASGTTLLLGGLSVLAGAYPTLGAGAVATFFVLVTPAMHDFWTFGGEEQVEQMTHFLKNSALLGAALAFLAVSGQEWAYSVGVSVF